MKDPRVDAYISKAAPFARPLLNHVRKLVHRACPDVQETMKWSMPHFEHKGILLGMAAFKAHCAVHFWKWELITGEPRPDGEGMGQFGLLKSRADLPADRLLTRYIQKAVELNEAGVKKAAPLRPKVRAKLVVPDYFAAALKQHRKARSVFEDFSYSHRKEYLEWITEAKREETRAQRIKTALEWLAAGKPRHWKYAQC